MLRLTNDQWAKLLLRWSGLKPTPEVRLVCAVIASGITGSDDDDGPWVCGQWFVAYCRLLGLDPDFVREQVARAAVFEP